MEMQTGQQRWSFIADVVLCSNLSQFSVQLLAMNKPSPAYNELDYNDHPATTSSITSYDRPFDCPIICTDIY